MLTFAVPKRGARLGNSYALFLEDVCGLVMAAELMQPRECVKCGSDNLIFVFLVGE